MAILIRKGGAGSGNWGHAGRPGKVGGSAKRGDFLQSTLFNVSNIGGKWADNTFNRTKALEGIGYTAHDAILLSSSNVPIWILKAFYVPPKFEGGFDKNKIDDYVAFYNNHKDDGRFRDFVAAGFSFDELKGLEEKLSWGGGTLDEETYDELSELADELEIPFADVMPFTDWIYDTSDIYVDAYQLVPYLKAGVTDPHVADELAYYDVDPSVVSMHIREGVDSDDFAGLREPLDPLRDISYDVSKLALSADFSAPSSESKINDWIEERVIIEAGNHVPSEVPSKTYAYLRNKSVGKISDESGVDASVVDSLLSHWSETSNGDYLAQTTQNAIADMLLPILGTELSDYQYDNNFGSWNGDDYDNAKKVMSHLYAITQAELKKYGIEYVDLYRGVKLPNDNIADKDYKVGKVAQIDSSAAESWTKSINIATGFADVGDNDTATGLVVHARVPAERIISNYITGMGVWAEDEYVVAGNSNAQDYVEIVAVKKGKDHGDTN